MADVRLRWVAPDDWASHRSLRLEMLRAAPDAFCTAYEDVVRFDEATWRARIASATHIQAWLDDEPVATVGLWDGASSDSAAASLVAMYVAPRARGRGVGERLVRAVLDEAAHRGHGRVVLEVTEGNAPAIALYERMGFRFTGSRRPHPRRADLRELEMSVAVGPPGGS